MIKLRLFCTVTALLLLCNCTSTPANQALSERSDVQDYINELVQVHHFEKNKLEELFSKFHSNPQVLRKLNHPYEEKPWYEYQAGFLTKKRIQDGVKFAHVHRCALAKLERKYGVPASIIVAIIGIETNYGECHPKFQAVEALATIAFSNSKRREFFKSELTELLLLSREKHIDPLSWRSSYAGALGIPQFMPSSYRHYAIDYFSRNQIDLDHDMLDSIASVANYLQHFGWQPHQQIVKRIFSLDQQEQKHVVILEDKTEKEYWLALHDFDVIRRYNTSSQYAMAVYELAEAIKKRSALRH